MAHLLAHHEVSPDGIVVLRGIEIGVVHLRGGLRNVRPAGPDRGYSQPAIVPVSSIANFYAARSGIAVRVSSPSYYGSVQNA